MNNIIEFTPNGENTIKFVNSLFVIFFKECLGKTYNIAKDGNDKPSDVESVKIRLINLPKDVKDLLKWLDESTMFSFRFKSNNNISLNEKSYRGSFYDSDDFNVIHDKRCYDLKNKLYGKCIIIDNKNHIVIDIKYKENNIWILSNCFYTLNRNGCLSYHWESNINISFNVDDFESKLNKDIHVVSKDEYLNELDKWIDHVRKSMTDFS